MEPSKRRLVRVGAVVFSLTLGGAFIAYRSTSGREPAGAELPAPEAPMTTMPGSKSMPVFTPERVPADPVMHTSKRAVILTPRDLEQAPASDPDTSDPLATPDRLGPP